jgi:hypothetical protein
MRLAREAALKGFDETSYLITLYCQAHNPDAQRTYGGPGVSGIADFLRKQQ